MRRRPRRQVSTLRISHVGCRAGRLLPLQVGVGRGELVLVLAAEVLQLRAGGTGRFDVVLEGAGVAGNVALQGAEPVEGDGQRGDTKNDTGHLAHSGEMAAQRGPGRRGALGDHRQHEEGDGDAQRVEERHQERGHACMMVCGRHRNRREDRSGAGHEDQTETQAQDEAASLVGVARRAQPSERPLYDLADLGDQKAHRQQSEQGDAQPEQEVLGQVEKTEQRAGEQDGEAEAHHQPRDDHVGPPLARSRRTARHDDGNDGNDAGRQPGDQSTEERNDEELTHVSRSAAIPWRALGLLLLDCLLAGT